MFLLDTNVVSELRKQKPHTAVLAWLDRTSASSLHIAAVTVGEVQAGIELSRKPNPDKAVEIQAWLDRLVDGFRVIPADAAVFRQWALLMHGRSKDLVMDALLAATAQVHGLKVVSRNVRDFEALGFEVINPFEPT